MLGHMVGAAGAIGLMMCVQSIRTKQVPPTANLNHSDPDCDLDYVPNVGREFHGAQGAMCNAFGLAAQRQALSSLPVPDNCSQYAMVLSSAWSKQRKDVRALLRPFAVPSFARALPLIALDLGVFLAGSYAVVAASEIALKFLASLLVGLSICRMFVLGHDACHQSLTSSRSFNAWIGRILFLPSLSCYSLWALGIMLPIIGSLVCEARIYRGFPSLRSHTSGFLVERDGSTEAIDHGGAQASTTVLTFGGVSNIFRAAKCDGSLSRIPG
jgi:hypothetical protein